MPTKPEDVVGFLAYKVKTQLCYTIASHRVLDVSTTSVYPDDINTSLFVFVQDALGKDQTDPPG